MKKGFATILIVIYLVFTSGVVVKHHYCMDRLASTTLFQSSDEVCGNCGMHNEPGGCCHDEVRMIKVENDQQKAPSLEFSLQAPSLLTQSPSRFIDLPFENIDESRHFHNHSPPLLAGQDMNLLNCVFRI